jgi:hypothetical protein
MISFVLAFAMAFPIGAGLFRLLTGPDRAVARRGGQRRSDVESERARRTGTR